MDRELAKPTGHALTTKAKEKNTNRATPKLVRDG